MTTVGEVVAVRITPESFNCLGFGLRTAGSSFADTFWPTANRAYYLPFWVAQTVTVVKGVLANGGTIGGNYDIGIYSETYVKMASTGSIAHSSAHVAQSFDFTDTILSPGRYYMAISSNNSGVASSIHMYTTADASQKKRLGVLDQDTAFPLPSTATPVVALDSRIPEFGLSLRTQVP